MGEKVATIDGPVNSPLLRASKSVRRAAIAPVMALAIAPGLGAVACRSKHAESRPPDTSPSRVLYAQRDVDLHLNGPDGPVIGKLRAGARVTASTDAATPDGGASVAVTIDRLRGPLTAYVLRTALGPTAVPLAPFATPGGARVVFGGPAEFWFTDPTSTERLMIPGARCRDLGYWSDSVSGLQDIDGVQIRGPLDEGFQWRYGPRSHASLALCSARAVSRVGAQLLLTRTEENAGARIRDVTQSVPAVPDGYLPVAPVLPDPLAAAIERGASIDWIAATGPTLTCEHWKFESSPHHEDAGEVTLEARLRRNAPGGGAMASPYYPAAYHPAHGESLGRLDLDPIHPNPWRCDCTYQYTLVAATERVLTLVGYRMPSGAIAVAPQDIERWFLFPEDCEAARRTAAEAIEHDAAAALGAGFHVQEG
jgi:hypothetical protein